jgi:oligo-1,6-glucosidase
VYGEQRLIDPNDREVYAYLRFSPTQQLLIIANFTGESLTRRYDGNIASIVLNNYSESVSSLDKIILAPYQALIIELQ